MLPAQTRCGEKTTWPNFGPNGSILTLKRGWTGLFRFNGFLGVRNVNSIAIDHIPHTKIILPKVYKFNFLKGNEP